MVVSVVTPIPVVSAGIAVVVSIGAIGSGVVIIVVLSTVSDSLLALSPQDAIKRPIERAKMPNFTNIMTLFLDGYFTLIPEKEKGNPVNEDFFSKRL